MHKQAVAYRQAEALTLLESHAQAIKECLGLSPELQTTPAQKARDPHVSDLLRIEALAGFLGAVNEALTAESALGFDLEQRLAGIGYRITEDGEFVPLEDKAEGQGQPPTDPIQDQPPADSPQAQEPAAEVPAALNDEPPAVADDGEKKTGKNKGGKSK